MSNSWFSRYAKPKALGKNEIVYETAGARVTLFMGNDENDNQGFIKSEIKKNPHMILVFRGHSYSLNAHVPPEIFGNNPDAKILFIPGSCGSAGSIPAYLEKNPKSEIEFVAYTSTGQGQVTNALVGIFMREAMLGRKRSYSDIIKKDEANIREIKAQQGKPDTIKVTTLGEELVKYVNLKTANR